MVAWGYTLSSEEHGPRELVDNARKAEEAGFDFVSISDHFHPWVTAQGHSPFVWSVIGGIAAVTERIGIGTGVTCPILRTHPAIVAHAAATASLLTSGRFFLGVGTGENLNEHILGDRWPRPAIRLRMLEEAVEIIRALWTGDTVDVEGEFYEVENARIFDAPPSPPDIVVSGFGPAAITLAGRIGDGFWGHAGDADAISAYEDAGGRGPRYAQLNVCWAEDVDQARRTVHEIWPNSGIPGQLAQDLPTWTHFEQAAELVTQERAVEDVSCGPDPAAILEAVDASVEAGFDHIYFHQIGPDQDGFLRFWADELAPALRDR